MFSVCQFTLSELCCNTLAAAGITCLEQFQDFPLAVILLPIALFNIMRGVLRFQAVCKATNSPAYIGLAINGSVKAVHLAMLVYAGADDDYARLLAVTVLYSFGVVLLASANWKGYSEQALVTCFFADYGIITLHTRNSLMRSSPMLGMFLAFAAFCVSAVLLLSNPSFAEKGDGWLKAMTILVTIVFSYVTFAEWSSWAPFEGCLNVAYFGTAVIRCFIFGGDSLLNTRIAAVAFTLSDIGAIVALVFGSVIINPDSYESIINSDTFKQMGNPDSYIKVVNNLVQEDAYKKIISNQAFDQLIDKSNWKRLVEPDVYRLAAQHIGVNGALSIVCSLVLLIVTCFVFFETNQRLKDQWMLISREVDAAKDLSSNYWHNRDEDKCDENSEKLANVGTLFEQVEHMATMFALGFSLNLDGSFEDLLHEVMIVMTKAVHDKDVWFKVVYINGVCCSLRQRATYSETETSPKMLTDLADRLEQPDTLRLFQLSSDMYASDPAGDCGKCRLEHGVFKMLHYAASENGEAETKRRYFIIAAKRSYAKANDFERKAVVWKVAYS
jgi:hypothetical protein